MIEMGEGRGKIGEMWRGGRDGEERDEGWRETEVYKGGGIGDREEVERKEKDGSGVLGALGSSNNISRHTVMSFNSPYDKFLDAVGEPSISRC